MNINREYADFLTSFPKSHLLCVTTKNKLSSSRSRRLMGRILESLNVLTYFWVSEPHHEGGYHLHGFIDSKSHIARIKDVIQRKTAGGRVEVEDWRDSKDSRGENYLTKLVGKDLVDYDIGLDPKCHSKQQ